MIHPHTEVRFINDEVGVGVFATKPIPRGTITWTLCEFDRIFTPEEVAALRPDYRRFVEILGYIDTAGRSVLCWDGGRYMNHSCDSNTLPVIPAVDVAIRDLAAGEQITCDYGTCNLVAELSCHCGAPACRGVIGRRDALVFGAGWDEKAAGVVPAIGQVPQPLLAFVQERARLERVMRGEETIFPHAQYHLAQ